MSIQRIVSGGQTGVDRAALDVALARGLPCGGWCPRDRSAEDGPIPGRYPLTETPRTDPAQRTDWNVRDSDATLILARGALAGGTARARDRARQLGRPVWVIDLATDAAREIAALRVWIDQVGGILNVAGPRESEAPGIGEEARGFLAALLGRDDPVPLPHGGESAGGRQ